MKKAIIPALCSIFILNCKENLPTTADHGIEGGEPVAASVLAVTDRVFTDATGDVKIQVRTCDYEPTATAGKHCTYCALDQGWVMIGGGAEIEGSPSSARLRGSFPYPGGITPPVYTPDGLEQNCTGNTPDNTLSKDLIAWMARSDGASSHRLRAYVIGLQVAGLTETQLSGYRLVNDATTGIMTQPTKESGGFNLIVGGGANEVGSQNCYLTESRPNESANTWRGSAYCSSPGYLKVYSIQLNPCMTVPGWDQCMGYKFRSVVTGPVTGYGAASVTTPYPWITSSIGGKGVVNFGSSRFLADLLPLVGTSQGVRVRTKDQSSSVSGTTTAYSVNLVGGRWGTWRYNSIRFNTAGSSLHRPSGAAPVSLRQATTFSDAEPYRWNLESVGSGQYRIRNANPSQSASGECAYRQAGTSNVLVGPCNSTDEYKWTVVDEIRSVFKLRNVASGTCLDNNSSTTDADLRLAGCVTGYSTRQSLFLDAYSWPQ
jgi:hypothetical protein